MRTPDLAWMIAETQRLGGGTKAVLWCLRYAYATGVERTAVEAALGEEQRALACTLSEADIANGKPPPEHQIGARVEYSRGGRRGAGVIGARAWQFKERKWLYQVVEKGVRGGVLCEARDVWPVQDRFL